MGRKKRQLEDEEIKLSKGRIATENEENREIESVMIEAIREIVENQGKETKERIIEVAEGQKKIFDLVNRVAAEGIKMDWLLGLPARVDDMQSDIDEIYRAIKNMPVMRNGFRTLKDRVAFLEERINAVLDKIDRELGKLGKNDNTVIEGILDTLDEILCELGK